MIFCIGEILLDVYAASSKEGLAMTGKVGGASFNVAANLCLNGKKAGFYGVIGADPFGKYLKNTANPLPFSYLRLDERKGKRTTLAMVTLENGERSFSFLRDGAADYLFKEPALEDIAIEERDILCLGSLMLSKKEGRAFFKKAASSFKKKGALIAFDVNHREGLFKDEKEAFLSYMECVPLVDILKASEEELFLLSHGDVHSFARFFLKRGKLMLVSKGKKGSEVYFLNDKNVVSKTSASAKETKALDTTGAGDAFFAMTLSLLDGKDISKLDEEYLHSLLVAANEVGAKAITFKGALPAF